MKWPIVCVLAACGSDATGDPDWMATLDGSRSLATLTLPGTHDSGAIHEPAPGIAKTQTLTFAEQLDAGVRFFDVRCRNFRDQFLIYHGAIDQDQSFDDVVVTMFAFLDAHPSETIVASIKEENDAYGATLTFEQVFANYLAEAPSRWYLGPNVPSLADARGKIVLLRRFETTTPPLGIAAQPSVWTDNATFTIATADATLRVEDEYMVTSNDAKWSAITTGLDAARTGAGDGALYVTFTSGYQLVDGAPNIPNVATDIDQRFDALAVGATKQHLGIIVNDFMTPDRARAIAGTN